MRLAKAALDVGLFTTQREPMLAFWQQEIGLPFHETLPVGDGVRQLRHGIGESVLKINHSRDPLPPAPPAGYRQLTIAQPGVTAARELTDPDGNRVTLVPPWPRRRRAIADASARARPGRAPRFFRTRARTRADR